MQKCQFFIPRGAETQLAKKQWLLVRFVNYSDQYYDVLSRANIGPKPIMMFITHYLLISDIQKTLR